MEQILGLLSGGAGGAILVWLLRGWITERLKQSIKHEYSEKLESYKTDLNAKIQVIQHENQISQLRTSLFFDHQRNAFAGLLAKIIELNEKWFQNYDPDEGLVDHVPIKAYQELRGLFYEHQLFLDNDCLMAMDLVMDSYSSSFPFDDGSGGPPIISDVSSSYRYVEYLQPRIASIFRQKIGVMTDLNAVREVALLGAMKLINSYHFMDVELPPKGNLQIKRQNAPANVVVNAEEHINELLKKLYEFDNYLRKDGCFFHEAQLKLKHYISILDSEKMPKNPLH